MRPPIPYAVSGPARRKAHRAVPWRELGTVVAALSPMAVMFSAAALRWLQ